MQDDQGSSEGQMPDESGSVPGGAGRDDGQPGQAAEHAQPDLPVPGFPHSRARIRPARTRVQPGPGTAARYRLRPGPGYGQPGPGYGTAGPTPDYGQPGYGYTTPLGYPGGYGQAGGYYPQPGTRGATQKDPADLPHRRRRRRGGRSRGHRVRRQRKPECHPVRQRRARRRRNRQLRRPAGRLLRRRHLERRGQRLDQAGRRERRPAWPGGHLEQPRVPGQPGRRDRHGDQR